VAESQRLAANPDTKPTESPAERTQSQVNFQIQDQEVDQETHVIELGGEVDLYTAPEFKERLVQVIEDGKKRLVVDLSKATFIDSTTLGVLVGGVKRLRPTGGSLSLVCTDQNISKIFEITGLDRVFPIYKSRDEALAGAAAGGTAPA
jgi:anti-sigma B factor antagonist